jgi:predicted transposase/invertase (TIGR01784 family)
LKVHRDLINSFETAHNRGLKEGDEKGFKRGIKQGVEKGIEQGKHQEKLELAKNLLDVLDVQTIAVKTGLTVEEIEGLKS